ncbi:MAG: ectoine hydroxylase [Steroidobacteraceae bacterium]
MSATNLQKSFSGYHDDPYRSRIDSQPVIVERVDPVLHGGADASGPLTHAQLAAFERDGYITLDDWLNTVELSALQAEAARLREKPDQLHPETLILERDSREVRSVFHIHEQNLLLGRLAADSRLVNSARQLLGDEVYVHQSRLNYKPGFSGKDFYWHSDFETWHVEDGMPRMRALSMSIALTENTEYNGPLMVMPGSHKSYVRCVGTTPDDHYKQSLRRQEYGVPDHASLRLLHERGGIVAPKGKPGKIVLFDCNIMHGSNSNISPLPRSNIFIVYNSIRNRVTAPYGDAIKPRPEFIATRKEIRAIKSVDGTLA